MTDKNNDSLSVLVKERGYLKANLTRFKTFAHSLNSDSNKSEAKYRLKKFEPIWDEFKGVQNKIEDIDSSETQLSERELFENQFFQLCALVDDFINNSPNSIHSLDNSFNSQNQTNTVETKIPVKLPDISITAFDGNCINWDPFIQSFDSLIHNNKYLTNIQRFHYLKSSVKGEAFDLIKSVKITDINYAIALKILKNRFDNKRLILKTHVKNLCNLPNVTKNSASSLRNLLCTVTVNLDALRDFGQPVQHWDLMLIEHITSKLDFHTIRDWEATKIMGESPTYQELQNFLENKCKILESLTHDQCNQSSNKHSNNGRFSKQTSHIVLSNADCKYCKRDHYTNTCDDLLKLSVESRINEIKKLKLCLNCLRDGHPTNRCRAKFRCKTCRKLHNTILHIDSESPNESSSTASATSDNEIQAPVESTSNHCKANSITQILLSTAIICVQDKNGSFQKLRCLLDQGSQSNLITQSACNRLSIKQNPVNVSISGITGVNTSIKNSVNVTIKSQYNAFTANISCLVLPEITSNLPLVSFNKENVTIPANLRLADPHFNVSSPIDVLIGAEIFWQLLCVGQINKDLNGCHLHKTHFGWIVGGKLISNNHSRVACNLAIDNLDSQLQKFWEVNEPAVEIDHTNEQTMCETHFKNSVKRSDSGRYIVKLPFVENPPVLGNSKQQAILRLYSLERKFIKQPQLKNSYSQFMKEYEELGHMEPKLPNEINSSNSFYLPHHAVFKESSTTSKLRVVFDGSAKSSSGVSLNDVLSVGPTIQDDLFSILIRFRLHQIALTADITKMYRQILVNDEDRNFQLILWRENPTDPIKTYQLKTVTYGLASAPFLAIRTLFQLAYDEKLNFPLAFNAIISDFYVDDLLTGCNDINTAKELKGQLIRALSKGGFELRKWCSNRSELREEVSLGDNSSISLDKQDSSIKVLGLSWNYHLDTFKYVYDVQPNQSHSVTKRTILSTIARLFDPLGLIGPILMTAKILLQKLWLLNIPWDTSVPIEIHTRFKELLSQFHLLNEFKINRQIIENYDSNDYELHGFCDASQAGYGACLYLRCMKSNNNFSCNLICARSRVAPTKVLSIPRLELCGALLLANLLNSVNKHLNTLNLRYFLWTDSTIVLAWLKTNPMQLKTFVANRVSKIQSSTNIKDWHHINSNDNPADIISRGSTPLELIRSELWWHGPTFLKYKYDDWVFPEICTDEAAIPEMKPILTCVTTEPLRVFNKFSSFHKLQRVMSYALRFINRCKGKQIGKLTLNVSYTEIQAATNVIILCLQRDCFTSELESLKKASQLTKKSSLASLNPFIDDIGLIRVGGRLKNSTLPFSSKHPVLLPANHHVTKLIIRQEHEKLLHAGQQGTLAAIRRMYWPISGKRIVRKIIHECVRCFKAKPKAISQFMGNLPPTRVTPSRPFSISGVDFAGPISLKQPRGRNSNLSKGYIVVFVCFSTRAMHLELASDLTTQCFLGALKRFMSRRGNVVHLYSDNATNFTGADRELKNLYKIFKSHINDIQLINESDKLNIAWHHIPPRSPHFGGLWESGVKSVKHHLRRIVGNASLTYEEMYTLLTRIEAVLNSRPLYPLSDDPNDLSPLTPGHFLIGEPLTSPAEPDLTDVKVNRLARWEYVESLRQHFWKRWSREYLNNLQQRSKWKRGSDFKFQIGALALLCEDNQPPLRWPLGRIVQLHPGTDGIVRVVSLKTNSGIVRRAITKICVLPVQNSDNV